MGKGKGDKWETASLEWIHHIREERHRKRHGKALTDLDDSDFAAGIELARKLGLMFRQPPAGRDRTPSSGSVPVES